jgi:hypothetical protein
MNYSCCTADHKLIQWGSCTTQPPLFMLYPASVREKSLPVVVACSNVYVGSGADRGLESGRSRGEPYYIRCMLQEQSSFQTCCNRRTSTQPRDERGPISCSCCCGKQCVRRWENKLGILAARRFCGATDWMDTRLRRPGGPSLYAISTVIQRLIGDSEDVKTVGFISPSRHESLSRDASTSNSSTTVQHDKSLSPWICARRSMQMQNASVNVNNALLGSVQQYHHPDPEAFFGSSSSCFGSSVLFGRCCC